MTQAARLIAAIRRTRGRGMTYLEMEMLRISTSPWKRISEAGHRYLKAGEKITRKTGADGLVRIVVARG